MKKYRLVLLPFAFLLAWIILPTTFALAQVGQDRIIPAGEALNDDVTLFDGDLTIEEGAVVNGPVTLYDGDLHLAGTVNGAITLFNGRLEVTETGVLNGACVLVGGELVDNSGHSVNCSTTGLPAFEQLFDNVPIVPPVPPIPTVPPIQPVTPFQESHLERGFSRFVGNVAETAGWTFTLGVLALIIASVFPRQLHQVSLVISEKPVASGTVGLLTSVAGASLIALMSAVFGILILACGLGLLGFPIVMLVSAALAAAAILGWVAIGQKVGLWLAETLKLKSPTLPTTTVLGTVALSLMVGILNILGLEFGQWILTTIIGAVGLGAAALTQFGTRPYPVPYVDPTKVAAAVNNMPE